MYCMYSIVHGPLHKRPPDRTETMIIVFRDTVCKYEQFEFILVKLRKTLKSYVLNITDTRSSRFPRELDGEAPQDRVDAIAKNE